MIHERLMQQGSFSIPLSSDTPWSVWEDCDTHGHIVIFPQYIDALSGWSDADLLGLARYSGVLLDKRIAGSQMRFEGAGMVWWLGDEEGKGEIIETEVVLSGSTVSNALDNLLPSAITKGTVTEPENSYTGTHQFETPLAAIRTVMSSTSCEFRVNPDGTIDAGANYDLFPTIDTPTVVIVRKGAGGGTDPNYLGIPTNQITGHYSSRSYADRAIVVQTNADGSQAVAGFRNRSPAPTKTDIHGNTIARTYQTGVPTNDLASYSDYLATALSDHIDTETERINTDFFEVSDGKFQVGDGYWVYDPPMFRDTTNQIQFRGDTIFPKLMRLVEVSWTVRKRMGVWHRSPAATPVWTDLTQYVAQELTDSIGVLTIVERNEEGACL